MKRVALGLGPAALVVLGAVAVGGACSKGDPGTSPLNTGPGSGGSSSSSGTTGSGGSGGKVDPKLCGNGKLDKNEQCDEGHFAKTCEGLGFMGGTLKCTPGCKYDTSGCKGSELCQDGIDNDGDGKIDCADSDCAAACKDPCAMVPTLADPSDVMALTTGHAIGKPVSCVYTGGGGPQIVFDFTPKSTGVLEVDVQSAEPIDVAIRPSCSDPAGELGCNNESFATRVLKVPCTAGQKLVIVLQGHAGFAAGPVVLQAASRPIKCGDGHTDGTEECDDGNTKSGDGCSATCTLEATETEPNDTAAQANALTSPWLARVNPMGDVDVVSFKVTAGLTKATLETSDVGDGACSLGLLDSYLEVLGTDGATVLAFDDDGGDGLCSRALAKGLQPGTYYARVTASPDGNTPTFAYSLTLSLDP